METSLFLLTKIAGIAEDNISLEFFLFVEWLE